MLMDILYLNGQTQNWQIMMYFFIIRSFMVMLIFVPICYTLILRKKEIILTLKKYWKKSKIFWLSRCSKPNLSVFKYCLGKLLYFEENLDSLKQEIHLTEAIFIVVIFMNLKLKIFQIVRLILKIMILAAVSLFICTFVSTKNRRIFRHLWQPWQC